MLDRLAALTLSALALAAVACQPRPTAGGTTAPETTTTAGPLPAQATPPTSTVTRPDLPRDELAKLTVNDAPYTGPAYRRGDWPHWRDPDRNGCDAREDALVAASLDKPHVARGCKVTAGRWPLVYVAGETTDSSKLEADHVVPLENANRSGGGTWSTEQRTRYANDPAVIWVVDGRSNSSKGPRGPDRWRPPDEAVWCTYARRWVAVKVTYGLTATTAERDALGQMLDTCNP